MFKLWSEIKPNIKKVLKPDLGLRPWDDLSMEEKLLIWQHLEWYFFDKTQSISKVSNYEFFGNYSEREAKTNRIILSIDCLNELYKVKNYASTFLEDHDLDPACIDFLNIFLNRPGDVVMELLSLYCRALLLERKDKIPYYNEGETEGQFDKRTKEWRFAELDEFAKRINEIFEDFGLNIYLTRQGFVPKQDKKITETIYEPVLSFLSDHKWGKVNDHFSNSFKYYQKKDYSSSITNSVSAIQAFLQITVNGKIGKGNISELISKAQAQSLIPNDVFSKQIFQNIESILARERQSKSGVHPKLEKADEKTSRLILNLAMVFIQHCI